MSKALKVSVDDKIYFIESVNTSISVDVKDIKLEGTLYQRKEILVDAVKRHTERPDEFWLVEGTNTTTGIAISISLPKVIDTPEKATNAFYLDKKDVDEAIVALAKNESKRIETIATNLLDFVQVYKDLIEQHSR